MSLGQKPQGPLRSFFPKGQNSVLGVHNLVAIGSGMFAKQFANTTGLPTGLNSGGVPEVSATLIATGVYDVRFPSTKSVDVVAQVYGSSGYRYSAAVNNLYGPSGSFQLELTRLVPTTITASGYGFIPTGSKVALWFYAAPTSDGLTSY